MNITEPAQAERASPILFAPKPGSLPFFIFNSKLNAVNNTDKYLIPRMDVCFDSIGGAQIISNFWGETPALGISKSISSTETISKRPSCPVPDYTNFFESPLIWRTKQALFSYISTVHYTAHLQMAVWVHFPGQQCHSFKVLRESLSCNTSTTGFTLQSRSIIEIENFVLFWVLQRLFRPSDVVERFKSLDGSSQHDLEKARKQFLDWT